MSQYSESPYAFAPEITPLEIQVQVCIDLHIRIFIATVCVVAKTGNKVNT